MTRWAVTFVCVAGLAAALVVSVRYGRRKPAVEERDANEVIGAWAGAARSMRVAAVAVLTGWVTTALIVGLGGRLMMRVAAATSSRQAQGMLTDAEEIVGKVTIGNSIEFMMFFATFFGGVLGLFYALLRRYLPGPAWFSGSIVAVILAGIAGPGDFTDPGNSDFAILEPTWLIALMLVALIVLYGTTLGAMYEWFNERVPRLSRGRAAWWYLPVLLTGLMPFNVAIVGIAGIGGAVLPASVRDAFRNRTLARWIGTIVAIACAYMAFTLATDLLQIAF